MMDRPDWDELTDTSQAPWLPPDVQRLADDLLARFQPPATHRDDPVFLRLTDWIADRADEIGILDSVESDLIIPIRPEAETANLSDEVLLESLDDPEDAVIDDEIRVAFVTAHFRDLLSEEIALDADYHPVCDTRPLVASDGRSALIGFGIRRPVYSGIEIEWFGLFDSREGFIRHLRGLGWLLDDGDLDLLSRERKLELWDRGEVDRL